MAVPVSSKKAVQRFLSQGLHMQHPSLLHGTPSSSLFYCSLFHSVASVCTHNDTPSLDCSSLFSDKLLARIHLESWIKREKSSWLKNPQGPLGKHWREDSPIAACHLIDFARMIHTITHNITPESIPCLNKKIKDNLLPNSSDKKQFNETFTELEVAYKLIERVSPLTIEPPIHGQRRCPDIAFRLPEGITYVDVTVFRGGPLEKYEDAKEHIKEAISRRVMKREKALNINIEIGLEPIKPDQIIKQVLDGMYESDTGEIPVGNKGRVQWEPCPIIERNEDSSISNISSFAGMVLSPGDKFRAIAASHASLALPSQEDVEKINKLLFNTLCNKLKEKHKQFPPNQPSFLIMKIGHYALVKENMLRTFRDHIWTQNDYRWLSGVMLFTPQQGFSPKDSDPTLELSDNPRAKYPVSASFGSMFKEQAQFRY